MKQFWARAWGRSSGGAVSSRGPGRWRLAIMAVAIAAVAIPWWQWAAAEAEPERLTADKVIDLAEPGACHTQGLTLTRGYLFASCVKTGARKAIIHRYPLPPGFPLDVNEVPYVETFDVTRKGQYHPSGLDHDDRCLWVAVAHYRSYLAKSRISCLDPFSMKEEWGFDLADHIGTLAALDGMLVAMNWDAKNFYRFNKDGTLLGKEPSPTGRAYQDCQGKGMTRMLCSTQTKVADEPAARVDLLRFHDEGSPRWSVERSWVAARERVPLGREGFAVIGDRWGFLPEDFPEADLYLYHAPEL